MDSSLISWHKDGHMIHFRLDGPEVVANPAPCPNANDPEAECRWDDNCIFEYSINVFGVDINVGSVSMDNTIEFAWAWQGPANHDEGQMWIIPVDDVMFGAWASQFDV